MNQSELQDLTVVTFKDRLRTEYSELEEKLFRLNRFMLTEVFNTLPEQDKELLVKQAEVMAAYAHILEERLNR